MRKLRKDLTGTVFGKLKVLAFHSYTEDENTIQRRAKWLVQCDCGRKGSIVGKRLQDKKVKECDKCAEETKIQKRQARKLSRVA